MKTKKIGCTAAIKISYKLVFHDYLLEENLTLADIKCRKEMIRKNCKVATAYTCIEFPMVKDHLKHSIGKVSILPYGLCNFQQEGKLLAPVSKDVRNAITTLAVQSSHKPLQVQNLVAPQG